MLVSFTRRICLVLVLCGSSAIAQTGDARVTAILRRGVELRQLGRDEAALQEFWRAYQLSQEPRVSAQIALAEQALGHWVDASTHIGRALASNTDGWIQRNRTSLEQARQEIERHVGRLLVTGGVTGAEVFVNGERVATLPMTAVTVLAGPDVLEVRADGFETMRRPIRVAAGAITRESATLTRASSDGQAQDTQGERRPANAPDQQAVIATDRSQTASVARPVTLGRIQLALGGGARFDPNDDTINPMMTFRGGYVISDHFLVGGVFSLSNENPRGYLGAIGGAEVAGEFGGSRVRAQVGVQAVVLGGSYAGISFAVFCLSPGAALLVFPTRAFYVGLQLRTLIVVGRLDGRLGGVDSVLRPTAIVEVGFRL